MKDNSQLNLTGELKEEMTETLQALQSSSGESPSILDTSDTTVKAKSPADSQRMTNLQDVPNAARLIQALAAKLGKLVEWKKLTLGDGREVYALIFPVGKWDVDSDNKLTPR